MAEKQNFYDVYDYGGRLKPGDEMKIEHRVVYSNNAAALSPLTALPIERLERMRAESANAEQKIFEDLQTAAGAWDRQAGNTALIDAAIEYVNTRLPEHTANEWQKKDHYTERSNTVYKMSYYVYTDTHYNRETKQSEPVAWHLTWNVATNAPHKHYSRVDHIAGQDRKRFTDHAAMERYLAGRIKAYESLFSEVSPPVPTAFEQTFSVNGQLLPGYVLEGQERENEQTAQVNIPGEVAPVDTAKPTALTATIAATEPKIQAQTEPTRAEQVTQMQPVSIAATEPKFQAQTEPTKAEQVTQMQPTTTAATEPKIQAQIEPTKAEQVTQLQPASIAVTEPKIQAQVEPTKAEREAQTLTATNADTEPKNSPQTALTSAEQVTQPQPATNAVAEPKIQPQTATITATEPKTQAQTAPTKAEQVTQPQPAPNAATEPKIQTQTEPTKAEQVTQPQAAQIAATEPKIQEQTPEPLKVNPIILTAENPRDRLKEITDRLEQGVHEIFSSGKYANYLNTLSKFHDYSLNNTLLIAFQKPDASLIAGFNAWRDKFHRSVRKGEKGIKIIAPAPFKTTETRKKLDGNGNPVMGADGKPQTEQVEVKIPSYKVVSVFDVSQTDGEPLPTLGVNELTGGVEQFSDFFAALEKTSPVPMGFEDISSGSKGYYNFVEKRIAIQEGMSEAQTLKTAIHEIAHARLHDADLNLKKGEESRTDKNVREIEAESVAYTVCQHFGLDTSEYSFGYVAGWSHGKEIAELKGSLEAIRAAAGAMINEIDAHFAGLQRDISQEKSADQTRQEGDTFTIFQLKNGDETRDLRFELFARLEAAGLSVKPENYEQTYTAPLANATTPENIFQQFNVNRPADFTGHSLSVSDIIVTNRNGEEAAFYVDSAGFKDVTREFSQLENPLKTAEMSTEQNLNMIDGIMNNGAEKPLSVADLEKQAQSGRPINLVDLADAVRREKTAPQRAKKQTIQGKLKAGKERLTNEQNAPKKAAKRENLEV